MQWLYIENGHTHWKAVDLATRKSSADFSDFQLYFHRGGKVDVPKWSVYQVVLNPEPSSGQLQQLPQTKYT